MCGFAGFVSATKGLESRVLETMTEPLKHRGPDDYGYFGISAAGKALTWKESRKTTASLRVGFGFRRLAILDLSPRGAQPMRSPDGRYTLVFNGQIYNYIELRKELLSDISFESTSDTEVLLQFLIRYGVKELHRLNGIFAFALYDADEKTVTIVRDGFGIKPLYYVADSRGVFFASEIRALFAIGAATPQIAEDLLSRFLMFGWVPEPDTLFRGVKKLEPGTMMIVDASGKPTIRRYWDLRYDPDPSFPENRWLEELEQALERVLDRQMRSDVPLGFFLSGGVDSSLLAAKAVSVRKEKPATFTTGFRWSPSSESRLDLMSARKLRDRFGFQHTELLLEPSIISVLPKVVAAMEEPVNDPAAVCSYLICEAASEKYTVMISGQGADELFGGYPVYPAGWLAWQIQHLPSPVSNTLSRLSARFPYSIKGRPLQWGHRLRKLLASTEGAWPEAFVRIRSALFSPELRELLVPDLYDGQQPVFTRHNEYFKSAKDFDPIHQMMYLDAKTYLVSTNLTYSDKTSMAHSVELRVPFLDKELVEITQRMPSVLKVSHRGTKVILKRLAERVLPRETVWRRKTGFGLPIREWMREELHPMAAELLSPNRMRAQGLFNPDVPSRWLSEHRSMQRDHTAKLYGLLCFQLWVEEFKLR